MVIRIIEDNTDKWINVFDTFGKVFLKNAADKLLESAIWWLEFHEAIDTGELLNSLEVIETKKGYKVVASAPHAATIEYGRTAGARNPPLEPLISWIRRKGIDVSKTKVSQSFMTWMDDKGLTTPSKSGRPTRQHKLVARAFYLMKRIAKVGIDQRPYFRPAIEDLRREVDKIVEMTKLEVGING